jgi:small subunit ribosomal protein S18
MGKRFRRRGPFRRKRCRFCVDKIKTVDYKDVQRLRKCMSDRGKIIPRRISATCARHQRQLTVAIKRARYMAMLPYVAE